jgi:hypothetical protein
MNSKLVVLFVVFGLLFTLAQCGRLTQRNQDEADDSNDNDDNDDSQDTNAALRGRKRIDFNISLIFEFVEEKQAIRSFLENEEDASEFLDHSRRLFSDQKSQMKEAKKK